MKSLTVVIGIVKNTENHVLIALRPPHVSSPGIWEFPGGKVESNETLRQALRREFQEEVGIHITSEKAFHSLVYQTEDKELFLHSFEVLSYEGEPAGCESQEIRWIAINELKDYEFPKANLKIIERLMLGN